MSPGEEAWGNLSRSQWFETAGLPTVVLQRPEQSDRRTPSPLETGREMTDALNGSEGGLWIVTTEGSQHWFDLEAMTVTRFPGPLASSTVNDQTRPLEVIVSCTVGKRGYWLMKAEGRDAEFLDGFWHLSSRIVSINPAPTGTAKP